MMRCILTWRNTHPPHQVGVLPLPKAASMWAVYDPACWLACVSFAPSEMVNWRTTDPGETDKLMSDDFAFRSCASDCTASDWMVASKSSTVPEAVA